MIDVAFTHGYGLLIPEGIRKERFDVREISQIHDDLAFDLLEKMLEVDPEKRISAEKALTHNFFTEIYAERLAEL